ncbi:protein kinase domain-containing protein [Streptomyces lunaelactis]|uniref:serine/threonine-protein kinase n=1 Tax=Streptomyces lunaelactis TaxID=1535768 RepID=UPI001585911C|nr:serine/threonine-protein kinase [Streptomyces lunaelactis]NUK25134.1 protein kinase [Streptomyces lunaelactis]
MNPLGTGDPLRLGPYRLLGVLGEGGMGKVYFGQDNSGRTAAVKVLRPELAHDQNLALRFVREAQMAQAVTSTGVARVLGAHTEGGRPWIATEFLTGPTLDQAINAHGPFDDPTVRALAAAIARTLADIHTAGLVHRDLKPANIVLTSDGPRVIDFGIARPEHGLTLTTTGEVPVTPGYGAPEQVMGHRVGPPADVFSLGALLAYAASGQRAYDGSHVAAVQYEVVHGEPRLSHLPEHLRQLIAPCLAKDPALRPTPGQITAAFAPPRGAERIWRHGVLADDIKQRRRTVHQLTTVVAAHGDPRRVSRRRLITALATGGAVIAAGGGTAAWWLRERETGQKPGPFAIPPAVRTPEARILSADKGDFVIGEAPTPLWGPMPVLAKDSPAPLPVRDVVAFGARAGGLAAHSVVDGKHRWTAPDVDAAALYCSLSDALIAAVDTKGSLVTFVASTGEPKWSAPAAEATTLLAADDEAVYVVTKSGRLRSIGRSDATVRWTARISGDLGPKARPRGAAAQGVLVVATLAGDVVAVDTADGRKKWDLPSQSAADGLRVVPKISGSTVYLNGRTWTARRIADGRELWKQTSTDAFDNVSAWGPSTVHGTTVYAAQGSYISGLNGKDGSEAWHGVTTGSVSVVLQGSSVWGVDNLNTGLGGGVAFDADSKKQVWTYPLTRRALHWITGDGNRIFVMDGAALIALPVF